MFSIPRDTLVEDATWGRQKMTHFYALGDAPADGKSLGNVDLTRTQIETLTGLSIDASLEVTFDSFTGIVDQLGGATIEGQTVSGAQALAAVRDRFSGDRSDFDRQFDARQVVQSLASKLVTSPTTARQALATVAANPQARLRYQRSSALRFGLATWLGHRGHITLTGIEEGSVPGSGQMIYTPDFGTELYYWVPDTTALQDQLHQWGLQ